MSLDNQMWESYRRDLKEHLRSPVWVAWFNEHQVVFSESLRQEVACIVEEIRREGTVRRPAAAPAAATPTGLPEPVEREPVEPEGG